MEQLPQQEDRPIVITMGELVLKDIEREMNRWDDMGNYFEEDKKRRIME